MVINNPAPPVVQEDRSNNGIIGIIVLAIVLILLFVYGLPFLQRATTAPQVNVPSQVDVNVRNPSN